MNLQESVSAIVIAHQLVNSGLPPILAQLQDKILPLEERWDAFTKLVKGNILVNENTYGDGFIGTLGENMTLYDDFQMERHETSTFVDMYEHIMEADKAWAPELVEAREKNLTQWQEKVLASGYSSFTYDW